MDCVMDDELEKLKPAGPPADMQSWNIEDLQNYIERMEAEIIHAKTLIADKGAVSAAADALFSKGNQ